jgi:hypothetical protein
LLLSLAIGAKMKLFVLTQSTSQPNAQAQFASRKRLQNAFFFLWNVTKTTNTPWTRHFATCWRPFRYAMSLQHFRTS